MTLYVSCAGRQGVGKSTLAKSIVLQLQERGFKTEITPFAETIKDIEAHASRNDWNYIYLVYQKLGYRNLTLFVKKMYEQFPSEPNVKNRKFLQYIGTELGRDIMGQDVWVNAMKSKAQEKQLDVAVVDDVRFISEAQTMDYIILLDHTLAFNAWEQICDSKGYDHKTLHSSEQDDLKPYATLIMKPYSPHFAIVEQVLNYVYFRNVDGENGSAGLCTV